MLVRLVNHRASFLTLPTCVVDGVEYKRTLLPGGNNVPLAYVEALAELPRDRGPGAFLAMCEKAGWITMDDDPEAVNLPEGPEPPRDLSGYRSEGAIVLAKVETHAPTVRKWLAHETRADVKAALQAQLLTLGA